MVASVSRLRAKSSSRGLWCSISFGLFGFALVTFSELGGAHKSALPFSYRGLRGCILCGLFGWALAKLSELGGGGGGPDDPIRSSTDAAEAYCGICMESKPLLERFTMRLCSHSFCSGCVRRYVAAKVSESTTSIRCPDPDCRDGFLEPEMCCPILPPDLLDRWCRLLCESSIPSKFYCPFRDCSAVLMDERAGNLEAIRESECPHCHRLFCARCEVPWHFGVTCGEYRKLRVDERGENDLKLVQMAKAHKLQRCLKCKFYVERSTGCMLIKCRCGFLFCYGCGSAMKDHYCAKCKR